MAKEKKIKESKEKKPPKGNIFDYIKWLTTDKKKWEELSYENQKYFNPFILNRFLGMDLYLTEAINELQEYTTGASKEIVWKIYYNILPKQRVEIDFIKAKVSDKLNEEDIRIFKKHFVTSQEVAEDYLVLLKKKGLEFEIENIKRNYVYEKFKK